MARFEVHSKDNTGAWINESLDPYSEHDYDLAVSYARVVEATQDLHRADTRVRIVRVGWFTGRKVVWRNYSS